MHELPLVFFTVLAQGTVGLFLVLACLLMANSDANRQQLLNKLLMVVLVLLGISGAAAMTHLGATACCERDLWSGTPLCTEC